MALDTLEPSDVGLYRDIFQCAYKHSQPHLNEILDKLKETHATSAGLKVGCHFA